MIERIKLDSVFISAHNPLTQKWLTHIYFGERRETGIHGHLILSGASLVPWYFRDLSGNEIIKNGEVIARGK